MSPRRSTPTRVRLPGRLFPRRPTARLRTSAVGLALALGLLVGPAHAVSSGIPAERQTVWNPGIPGGIPHRTTICAEVHASVHGNGARDATAAIQAALDACPAGQVVRLSRGDFKITSPLMIGTGVVLRGQGPAETKLRMPVGTNANVITIGTRWFKLTQPTELATDATKGRKTVELVRPVDLAVGEIVLIDQLPDPSVTRWSARSSPGDASRAWFMRPNRPMGQVMEVASVNRTSASVTFTTPFHIDMTRAYAAQLSRFSNREGGPVVPSVRYAGVEHLYVSGGSRGQGNLKLANAAYSWIENVESDDHDGDSVAIDASFRCVVRGSYFHSTRTPQPGGGGYGISLSWHAADNLVEDNIVWNMNKVMVMRASGGGNVIGYNYLEDGWIAYNRGWVEVGLNGSHMTTPHFELFEGNAAFNFDGDNTWGNSVYMTVFRNHLSGSRRSAPPLRLNDVQNRRAIGLMEGHWWYTVVGNVLGTADQQQREPGAAFRYEDRFPWRDNPVAMWRLGYNPERWSAPADPKVLSTLIRAGNYDYATRAVHWEAMPPQALPDSLYLAAEPAFFGARRWPWVDPTGPTTLYALPARERFDAMRAAPATRAGLAPTRRLRAIAAVAEQPARLYEPGRITARQASQRSSLPLPLRANRAEDQQ